jgi:hypothetical protein
VDRPECCIIGRINEEATRHKRQRRARQELARAAIQGHISGPCGIYDLSIGKHGADQPFRFVNQNLRSSVFHQD